MPRRCTACAHPALAEINQGLIAGVPFRDIARQFHISKDAVARHNQHHVPETLRVAASEQHLDDAQTLVLKLKALEHAARRISRAAEEASDLRVALQGLRELARLAELQARMCGELSDGPTVNVLVAVLGALSSFPEARRAVVTALEGGGDFG